MRRIYFTNHANIKLIRGPWALLLLAPFVLLALAVFSVVVVAMFLRSIFLGLKTALVGPRVKKGDPDTAQVYQEQPRRPARKPVSLDKSSAIDAEFKTL